jgi:hypothetical protein
LIDGPELFVAIVFGWGFGIIVSVLGMYFREPLLRIGRSLRKRTTEETKSSLKKKRNDAVVEQEDRAEGPKVN